TPWSARPGEGIAFASEGIPDVPTDVRRRAVLERRFGATGEIVHLPRAEILARQLPALRGRWGPARDRAGPRRIAQRPSSMSERKRTMQRVARSLAISLILA